jgi:hypothetical protein
VLALRGGRPGDLTFQLHPGAPDEHLLDRAPDLQLGQRHAHAALDAPTEHEVLPAARGGRG